jgi:hypothetical protein
MAAKKQDNTKPSPTTTVAPGSIADQLAQVIANAGGFNSVPAGSVSPSSRSAIGVQGTQTVDPLTGKVTGYFGFQQEKTLPQMGGFEPAGQTVTAPPKYFSGDEDTINKYSSEQIALLQSHLSANGLLGRKYTPGLVDDQTKSGYRKLLGLANRQGVDWQTALGTLSQVNSGGSLSSYQVSNPDDLKAVFRKAAQELLGRNLQDGDLNKLVETFQMQEKQYQQKAASGGVAVQAPSATTFAMQAIEQDFGDEVDTQKMDNIFGAIDQALSGGQR